MIKMECFKQDGFDGDSRMDKERRKMYVLEYFSGKDGITKASEMRQLDFDKIYEIVKKYGIEYKFGKRV